MRIAVTGAHGTGKTTLIEDFAAIRPDYESVPEPYWLLAQDGTPFADGATTGDLEQQLVQSCGLVEAAAGQPDVIFDRCPLDYLGYLDVVSGQEGFEWEPSGKLLGRIERALGVLDLVVFVPLQKPDEILVPIEHPRLRLKVDARLKTMLREDDLGLLDAGPRVLELVGSRQQRLDELLLDIHSMR